jgi:hypothetical protein
VAVVRRILDEEERKTRGGAMLQEEYGVNRG